jgi:hypothetical protein
MKALKLLQAVIVRGKKNILPRNILGNKKSCAALLQEKNICLIPLGGKKLLHSLNLPPPPPLLPPQKSNGTPLTVTFYANNYWRKFGAQYIFYCDISCQ